jgi:hypothetical protein
LALRCYLTAGGVVAARRYAATGNHSRWSLIWWLSHAAGSLVLILVTWTHGPWFWIFACLLAVSSWLGQIVLNRQQAHNR